MKPFPRWLDVVFAVAFCVFAVSSLVMEPYIVFGVDLRSATDPLGRGWCIYASSWDPILLDPPWSMRVMFGIDAFVFGPFYLVAAWAFFKRRAWIRVPALMYSAAMAYSMVVYFAEAAFGELAAQTDLLMVALISGPYTLMPFALAWRMRRPEPFGVGVEGRQPG